MRAASRSAPASADGEEFPFFRTFWLEKPADGRMVIHALLDSQSLTGAYRFTVRPGAQTQIDVEAILFARAEVTRLGLAPLTSMYLFGSADRGTWDDPRLSVHNSDGLAIWNGKDERLWRPLQNPRLLQISSFADTGPRGFGLIQREKRFSEYEDLDGLYHIRPSLWVEPIGDWGPGSVVLVEIPSDREINDNVVAFWRPEAPIAAGDEMTLTYRLTWGWDGPIPPGLLRVTRTLSGAGSGPRPAQLRHRLHRSRAPRRRPRRTLSPRWRPRPARSRTSWSARTRPTAACGSRSTSSRPARKPT